MPDSRVRLLTEATRTFQASLDDTARTYLASRDLGDAPEMYGVGLVPGEPEPEWAQYTGMLAIPYYTVEKQVVSIRFRTIDPDDRRPKYLQPPGSEITIYNMPALAKRSKTIIITEGEIDCMTLDKMGYAAIGMPGANSWKPHYARALDSYERVIVWGDPDEAGQKFNETIMASIRRATSAHLVADINDTYRQDGGMFQIIDAFERAGGITA